MNQPFSDPQVVARYAEGPPRNVPGYDSLVRMTSLLLAERVPDAGRVLVLGAGGGLELKAFAQAHPDWRLDGVDPSSDMLALARQTLGDLVHRAQLHAGYIGDAPPGPFDGACCLLTMHFVPRGDRLGTLAGVHARLRRGAPFVLAHFSFPQAPGEREVWLARHAAYLVASGVEPERAGAARAAIEKQLHILAPEDDEALLREAGFRHITPFYAGMAFRGWVAYADARQ